MLGFILSHGRGRAIAPDTTRITVEIATSPPDEEPPFALDEYEAFGPSAAIQVAGAGALIEYDGGSHGRGLRPLSVSRIERRGDHLYLMAVCHLSGSPKMFREDRIISIVDPGTGEAFTSLLGWHNSRQFTDLGILHHSRNDLILLSYLARSDGRVCDAELDQIELFLDHIAVDIGERCPSRAAIETMAYNLAPDWTSASLACSKLSREPERARRAWRGVRRIVDADGILHASEHELLAEVQSALRVA
jgi:hypothetical protein